MAYKILIVDDEKMLTELLSSHLQKCGYEAFVAENAERTIFYGEKPLNLSNREFDIVEFLMRNANQIFDKERIYEAVWGLMLKEIVEL